MADPVRRVLAMVPLLAALLVCAVVPMPMFTIGPGPARDVLPRIHVQDHEVFTSRGQLLLTTVSLQRPTAVQALQGWLDRYVDVVAERRILPPGLSEAEENRIQLSQMDESKLTAASVALSRVTDYPRSHGLGALVLRAEPGGSAEGALFPGDLIVAADGRQVAGPQDVEAAMRGPGGGVVSLRVRVEDQTRTVRIPRTGAGLGADLLANFPFPLLIQSEDIGGPSAGLMWAIGLIDLLTPGDLTGGRKIAGTGSIELDGSVGPIGGIGQKIVAADRAGAHAFLVPRADLSQARAVGSELELVAVDDVQDALDWLASRCGCPVP